MDNASEKNMRTPEAAGQTLAVNKDAELTAFANLLEKRLKMDGRHRLLISRRKELQTRQQIA